MCTTANIPVPRVPPTRTCESFVIGPSHVVFRHCPQWKCNFKHVVQFGMHGIKKHPPSFPEEMACPLSVPPRNENTHLLGIPSRCPRSRVPLLDLQEALTNHFCSLTSLVRPTIVHQKVDDPLLSLGSARIPCPFKSRGRAPRAGPGRPGHKTGVSASPPTPAGA